MTSTTLAVVYFLGLAAMSRADIPDGYILQVTPTCGSDAVGDANIRIVTDLNANAFAVCAGGNTAEFTTSDRVNFNLKVSYPNQGSQPCVFNKRQNSLVFAVKVAVAYGETGSLVHQDEEEFTVTCTFSPKGQDDSANQNVIEGLIAPAELQANVGPDSPSNFTVELVDVLGNSFEGRNVALGRIVQLRGLTAAQGGEIGIRPVSCYAIDGAAKYAILRAGCGDGIIFPKNKGFITTGTTTLSPYFDAFSINVGSVIKFRCNFITCTSNCDGCSCKVETGKYDVTVKP